MEGEVASAYIQGCTSCKGLTRVSQGGLISMHIPDTNPMPSLIFSGHYATIEKKGDHI